MTPDYQRAAIAATEMLIRYNICTAPIDPEPIIKKAEGALLVPFADVSENIGVPRSDLTSVFHDAVTVARPKGHHIRYLVSYNQRLPHDLLHRLLARELGHIVLGHDGSRPESVRMEEAYTFALHFLFPRPLIHAIQQSGFPLTTEALFAMTGCDARCLERMRKTPAVTVPAWLNRQVRDQFTDYINNFLEYEEHLCKTDNSELACIGSYMEGYEE